MHYRVYLTLSIAFYGTSLFATISLPILVQQLKEVQETNEKQITLAKEHAKEALLVEPGVGAPAGNPSLLEQQIKEMLSVIHSELNAWKDFTFQDHFDALREVHRRLYVLKSGEDFTHEIDFPPFCKDPKNKSMVLVALRDIHHYSFARKYVFLAALDAGHFTRLEKEKRQYASTKQYSDIVTKLGKWYNDRVEYKGLNDFYHAGSTHTEKLSFSSSGWEIGQLKHLRSYLQDILAYLNLLPPSISGYSHYEFDLQVRETSRCEFYHKEIEPDRHDAIENHFKKENAILIHGIHTKLILSFFEVYNQTVTRIKELASSLTTIQGQVQTKITALEEATAKKKEKKERKMNGEILENPVTTPPAKVAALSEESKKKRQLYSSVDELKALQWNWGHGMTTEEQLSRVEPLVETIKRVSKEMGVSEGYAADADKILVDYHTYLSAQVDKSTQSQPATSKATKRKKKKNKDKEDDDALLERAILEAEALKDAPRFFLYNKTKTSSREVEPNQKQKGQGFIQLSNGNKLIGMLETALVQGKYQVKLVGPGTIEFPNGKKEEGTWAWQDEKSTERDNWYLSGKCNVFVGAKNGNLSEQLEGVWGWLYGEGNKRLWWITGEGSRTRKDGIKLRGTWGWKNAETMVWTLTEKGSRYKPREGETQYGIWGPTNGGPSMEDWELTGEGYIEQRNGDKLYGTWGWRVFPNVSMDWHLTGAGKIERLDGTIEEGFWGWEKDQIIREDIYWMLTGIGSQTKNGVKEPGVWKWIFNKKTGQWKWTFHLDKDHPQ